MVDYANILVLGITAALAWELPDEPFYPNEELMEIYQEGRLPLLEPEPADEEDEDEDDNEKRRKSKPIKSKPTKPIFKSSSSIPLRSSNDREYFNQPASDRNSHPINAHTYSQPHPYYTNFELDNYPPLDTYYYPDGRFPSQAGAGQPNSNKLKYYLSLADEFFKEYNAQQQGLATGSTEKPADTLKKRIDVKYAVLTPLSYFISFSIFHFLARFSSILFFRPFFFAIFSPSASAAQSYRPPASLFAH